MESQLTKGRIGATLLQFAWPFLLANLLQALYGAADLFVVGRFSSSAAVSAVGTGSQLMQTITGLVLGLATGSTVLIGQFTGAREPDNVAKTIGTSACLFALLALLFTPLALLIANPAIGWMNVPAEAVPYARDYIIICSLGIPFIIGYNILSAILRGLGNSKLPMVFIAIACAVNIALDLLLVGVFSFHAAGAAAATVFAQGLSFVIALIYLKRRGFSFPFHRSHLRLDRALSAKILKLGFPLALQDVLVGGSFLIITAIVNGMGLIASASVGVVERIMGFAMLPPGAFSAAVATMTAHNIGANKPRRALRGAATGMLWSFVFGLAFCVYAQIAPESATAVFSADPAVVKSAALYFRSFSIDCVLVAFVFCLNAYFTGVGRSVFTMAHSLVTTFLVRIPLTYLFSRMEGVTMYEMGLAAPAASLASIAICAVYLWLHRRDLGILKSDSE